MTNVLALNLMHPMDATCFRRTFSRLAPYPSRHIKKCHVVLQSAELTGALPLRLKANTCQQFRNKKQRFELNPPCRMPVGHKLQMPICQVPEQFASRILEEKSLVE